MLAWNQNLYKLFNAQGRHIATLTARTEEAAIAAYEADNKEAQPVARVERCSWGYPCEVFSTWS